MIAGVVALAGFVLWERRISRSHRAQEADFDTAGTIAGTIAGTAASGDAAATRRSTLPIVDLGLFGSAGFTWGTILSTLVSFALFGLVFAMPQYFLDVRGLDSLASGFRMLPMIGGLGLGLVIGQRLHAPRKSSRDTATPVPLVSPKVLVAIGFAIMAAALATGTGTTLGSSTGFAATWFACTGFGLGIAMPTALNAALGALSPAHSGSGSALITAMRQVGGTIGVAALGTVLATVYRSHLHLAGLPAAAQGAIKESVAGGVATAQAAGSQALLDAVRIAYVHGLDVMLWVCSGIAIASALLGLAFLPGRAQAKAGPDAPQAGDTPDEMGRPATSVAAESRMTT